MTRRTLDGMALGGMYDLVGGGFHRYSVDERWLVPHFEKMLYDNAQLASVYMHAARAFGDERYQAIADATIDYVLRELALDGGGFASSQDADTDGVEGLTFTWAPGEARRTSCCSRSRTGASSSAASSTTSCASGSSRCARNVRSRRATTRRSRRGTGSCWPRSRRPAGVEPAVTLGEFLLGPLSTPDGRLQRTWRDGVAKGTGYLEDYADVAYGLLELHVATGDPRWLREAHRLATLAVDLFADEHGGFFQAPVDGEPLVARKKELDDHPTPSGNAMLAYVLLRLARIWGDDGLERRAASAIGLARDACRSRPRPSAGCSSLCSSSSRRTGSSRSSARPRTRSRGAPRRAAATDVVAFGPAEDVPLLAGRSRSTACRPSTAASGSCAAAGHRPRERLSSQPMALLEIRNVTRRFGGIVAIDDVSLDVQAGPDRRPDRAERRRQDDALQRHHPALQAGLRPLTSTARACCARRRTASFAAGSRARSRTSSSSGR